MEAGHVELIPFKVPEDEGRSLYVSALPTNLNHGELAELMNTLFSQFGLVYDVHLPVPDHAPPTIPGYGFVKFYSQHAASRAMDALDQKGRIGEKRIRVQFAARRQTAPPPSRPLYISKCQELANHYLGFNGWSVNIVSMTACEGRAVCYQCSVELKLRVCEELSIGTGQGEVEPTDRAKTIGMAKKMAYHRACENAFSKIIMAVLPNGKALPRVASSCHGDPSTAQH